ncbi:MAG: biotin/lipoyl-containing protein [Bacillota bacterium]
MKYKITLKGIVYEVEVEKGEAIVLDEYEAMAPAPAVVAAAPVAVAAAPVAIAAPAAAAATGAGDPVPAPLPGAIVNVKASVGQTVKEGETVLILEAMKMENEIPAPKAGKIVSILVSKGQTVASGDILFEIA